jgi:hypothetical protein
MDADRQGAGDGSHGWRWRFRAMLDALADLKGSS